MVIKQRNNLAHVFQKAEHGKTNNKSTRKSKAQIFGALSFPLALLAGCSDDSSSSGDTIEETFVPYNTSSLPMPNDGYGYDEDGTISLPGEPLPGQLSDQEFEAYYQSYETSVGALDGWGMSNVIKVPIANRNTEERYPLDQASLKDNVKLISDAATGNPQEIPVEVISTGSEIEIKPLQVLDNESIYYIAINDRVLTQDGLALEADSEFTRIKNNQDGDLTDQELEIQAQLLSAENHFQIVGGVGELVYAAQFTTQSVNPVLDEIINNNANAASFTTTPAKVPGFNQKYDNFTTTLALPYYLPVIEDDDGTCSLDPYDPIANCPELYSWTKTSDGGHLTKDNPVPAEAQTVDVPVLMYAPKGWKPTQEEKLPVVMFVHGITGKKENADTMTKDLVDKGYLVVAIDQIYHGERVISTIPELSPPIADDGDNTGIETEDDKDEISVSNNSAFFINITSPLTLRSNLHQAISDQLSLRFALSKATDWVDTSEVHLIGHSLGAIMSVMVSEQSQKHSDLTFETVNFAVPGQGLTGIVLESPHLGHDTEMAIKKSPDVQRGIAESLLPDICTPDASNEECITALNEFVGESQQNRDAVAMLENDIYSLILPTLIQNVQTTVDSGDPVSHTKLQRENQQKTVLIQAKGNCGDDGCQVGEYLPDNVIPNSSTNNLLTGTEPLITALGLERIISVSPADGEVAHAQSGTEGIRGFINGTVGGHGTYLFPYEGPMNEDGVPGLPDKEQLNHVWSATDTQQSAIAKMIETAGEMIIIKDASTVEGANHNE
ncbi:dienelactone hydrolase family protein [Litoribacillus peritrichatus]|uniref:Bacterial virulence factor lipase N-terminal domain-containing protein n=1 Tax=Litoribacillus peritrichatus TaxID=718191 RepID=A0ABP7MU53_9GAMM